MCIEGVEFFQTNEVYIVFFSINDRPLLFANILIEVCMEAHFRMELLNLQQKHKDLISLYFFSEPLIQKSGFGILRLF